MKGKKGLTGSILMQNKNIETTSFALPTDAFSRVAEEKGGDIQESDRKYHSPAPFPLQQ